MPCYWPVKGYWSRERTDSGKRKVVFSVREGYQDLPVTIPCGRCIGCRLERSKQWAIRCVHEAQMHEENEFVTLTYNDQNLPDNSSLNLEDIQKFLKRLRKYVLKSTGQKIRYLQCGEYGEKLGRPHHHILLFGYRFKDREYLKTNRSNGEKYYTSKKLEELWGKGHVVLGELNFETAAYVARYITKKVNGDKKESHYEYMIGEGEKAGELGQKKQEYITMSRRPGIGKEWIEKYHKDVYPLDKCVIRGKEVKPPKFYDKYMEEKYPLTLDMIKNKRKELAKMLEEDNTPERLEVKETVKLLKAKQLKRSYENGET